MKTGFKKFNIADAIIIIGIIAIVSGLLLRNPIERMFTDLFYQKNIEYVVSISANDAKLLREGTEIKDVHGDSLGTVKFIKPNTSARDDNGIIIGYNVTIETVGMTDKLGTYIGNSMFIAPRMSIEVYSGSSDPIVCVVKKIESDR
ncbi:MAG: hypothetical protein E7621_06550 [Ruminococcaceae bacterium]|nr:hypothetical protein [Oscillospiraceae bacterium]